MNKYTHAAGFAARRRDPYVLCGFRNFASEKQEGSRALESTGMSLLRLFDAAALRNGSLGDFRVISPSACVPRSFF
jgi:hypothetical protein